MQTLNKKYSFTARLAQAYKTALAYFPTLYGGFQNRKTFEELENFVIFFGYPRSGHSLFGSLLDAHPHVIVAHELDVLRYVRAGFNKLQIYYLLLQNSRSYAVEGRRDVQGAGYFYDVPNQWQGRFNKLKVIGDKKGTAVTRRLRSNPQLLKLFQKTLDIPIKFIHVIRNPYDNISTIYKRNTQGFDLMWSINYYFDMCDTTEGLLKQLRTEDVFEVRHEAIIDDPKIVVKDLCSFLNLETTQDYLEDCASIVFKSPRKTRYEVEWTDELLELVQSKIEQYPFLKGYTYKD